MTQSPGSQPTRPVRTYLFEACRELNARMTPFAGWEMPVQFSGITQEHQAVRTDAGIFDISHMGKFSFKGKHLLDQLQALVPSDLSRLKPGQAQYTVLLTPDGTIIDDWIFYYQGQNSAGEHRGLAIVNAATRDRDKAWILEHLNPEGLFFRDLTQNRVLVALQGPRAAEYLQPFVTADLSKLSAFGHVETIVLGQPSIVARTGYTGEDGFEIMVDPPIGKVLWRSLVEAGVTPCGLGARDTLRLEAAMALYGQDIDNTTTPLEAGLKWLVHLDRKGDFIGREALERQQQDGLTRRLVGLKMEGRHIARHGYPVVYNGEQVGEVTSGAPSPTLGYPIALAYVPPELGKVGTALQVEIRGKTYPAVVVKKPFYRRGNG
ncbi:MAG TPA: glycine cleavage system aminomethyltransferase GcvT [Oscillatoriales cyanobacterium M59_W2019_021]|nr:MAG: glycine cleavage system aminomethyltransferase GcvT [Cyanobacteria bacterium J055]HIK30987.1 glycine cleavage system aminomethyltransferase GcvT [Oscillatoriales cyanobacterium M4454_W2019_049]HIK50843.1 glycine cleavage system aminomethyltransferase GcvT [Oscillatoriales cyanobacterium M59_W2019_021]